MKTIFKTYKILLTGEELNLDDAALNRGHFNDEVLIVDKLEKPILLAPLGISKKMKYRCGNVYARKIADIEKAYETLHLIASSKSLAVQEIHKEFMQNFINNADSTYKLFLIDGYTGFHPGRKSDLAPAVSYFLPNDEYQPDFTLIATGNYDVKKLAVILQIEQARIVKNFGGPTQNNWQLEGLKNAIKDDLEYMALKLDEIKAFSIKPDLLQVVTKEIAAFYDACTTLECSRILYKDELSYIENFVAEVKGFWFKYPEFDLTPHTSSLCKIYATMPTQSSQLKEKLVFKTITGVEIVCEYASGHFLGNTQASAFLANQSLLRAFDHQQYPGIGQLIAHSLKNRLTEGGLLAVALDLEGTEHGFWSVAPELKGKVLGNRTLDGTVIVINTRSHDIPTIALRNIHEGTHDLVYLETGSLYSDPSAIGKNINHEAAYLFDIQYQKDYLRYLKNSNTTTMPEIPPNTIEYLLFQKPRLEFNKHFMKYLKLYEQATSMQISSQLVQELLQGIERAYCDGKLELEYLETQSLPTPHKNAIGQAITYASQMRRAEVVAYLTTADIISTTPGKAVKLLLNTSAVLDKKFNVRERISSLSKQSANLPPAKPNITASHTLKINKLSTDKGGNLPPKTPFQIGRKPKQQTLLAARNVTLPERCPSFSHQRYYGKPGEIIRTINYEGPWNIEGKIKQVRIWATGVWEKTTSGKLTWKDWLDSGIEEIPNKKITFQMSTKERIKFFAKEMGKATQAVLPPVLLSLNVAGNIHSVYSADPNRDAPQAVVSGVTRTAFHAGVIKSLYYVGGGAVSSAFGYMSMATFLMPEKSDAESQKRLTEIRQEYGLGGSRLELAEVVSHEIEKFLINFWGKVNEISDEFANTKLGKAIAKNVVDPNQKLASTCDLIVIGSNCFAWIPRPASAQKLQADTSAPSNSDTLQEDKDLTLQNNEWYEEDKVLSNKPPQLLTALSNEPDKINNSLASFDNMSGSNQAPAPDNGTSAPSETLETSNETQTSSISPALLQSKNNVINFTPPNNVGTLVLDNSTSFYKFITDTNRGINLTVEAKWDARYGMVGALALNLSVNPVTVVIGGAVFLASVAVNAWQQNKAWDANAYITDVDFAFDFIKANAATLDQNVEKINDDEKKDHLTSADIKERNRLIKESIRYCDSIIELCSRLFKKTNHEHRKNNNLEQGSKPYKQVQKLHHQLTSGNDPDNSESMPKQFNILKGNLSEKLVSEVDIDRICKIEKIVNDSNPAFVNSHAKFEDNFSKFMQGEMTVESWEQFLTSHQKDINAYRTDIDQILGDKNKKLSNTLDSKTQIQETYALLEKEKQNLDDRSKKIAFYLTAAGLEFLLNLKDIKSLQELTERIKTNGKLADQKDLQTVYDLAKKIMQSPNNKEITDFCQSIIYKHDALHIWDPITKFITRVGIHIFADRAERFGSEKMQILASLVAKFHSTLPSIATDLSYLPLAAARGNLSVWGKIFDDNIIKQIDKYTSNPFKSLHTFSRTSQFFLTPAALTPAAKKHSLVMNMFSTLVDIIGKTGILTKAHNYWSRGKDISKLHTAFIDLGFNVSFDLFEFFASGLPEDRSKFSLTDHFKEWLSSFGLTAPGNLPEDAVYYVRKDLLKAAATFTFLPRSNSAKSYGFSEFVVISYNIYSGYYNERCFKNIMLNASYYLKQKNFAKVMPSVNKLKKKLGNLDPQSSDSPVVEKAKKFVIDYMCAELADLMDNQRYAEARQKLEQFYYPLVHMADRIIPRLAKLIADEALFIKSPEQVSTEFNLLYEFYEKCPDLKPEVLKAFSRLAKDIINVHAHYVNNASGYTHTLMYLKELPSVINEKPGIYLYRCGDPEEIYTLVIHNADRNEILCLSEIAKQQNKEALLTTINWLANSDKEIRLDKTLENLIFKASSCQLALNDNLNSCKNNLLDSLRRASPSSYSILLETVTNDKDHEQMESDKELLLENETENGKQEEAVKNKRDSKSLDALLLLKRKNSEVIRSKSKLVSTSLVFQIFQEAQAVKPLPINQLNIPLIAVVFDNIFTANKFSQELYKSGKMLQDDYSLKIDEGKDKTWTVYISRYIYNNIIMNDDEAYAKLIDGEQTNVAQL